MAVQLVQNHGVVTQFMTDLALFTQNILFNQCHTFCMKSSGHHSFSYQAPTTWNQHPVSAHHPTSVSLLNSSLKILLFSKPFLHLHFPVCVRACVCVHVCISVSVSVYTCISVCTVESLIPKYICVKVCKCPGLPKVRCTKCPSLSLLLSESGECTDQVPGHSPAVCGNP